MPPIPRFPDRLLVENDGLPAMNEYPVLGMQAHPPCQNKSLRVSSLSDAFLVRA